MTDLTSAVLGQLDQSHVETIARQLGVDPAQAQGAIQQALPMLMASLARNASSEQGATALSGALNADHAGVDIGSMLGSVLAGGGAGNAILGHIFGARQDQAAQGLGQTTGLGAQGAGQLMAMLAPLVMGVLGNMQRSQGLGSSGLAGVLGQEAQRVQQGGIGGLLGSIFDRDGDGKVGLDEIAQVGQGLLGAFNKRV